MSLGIGPRAVLHHRSSSATIGATKMRPILARISSAASGFFLLRHDRRPVEKRLGQLHEAETCAEDQITSLFGASATGASRRSEGRGETIRATNSRSRDRVERIRPRAGSEAQRQRAVISPVDREGGAGKGRRPGAFVHPPRRIHEAPPVAGEHSRHIGHHVMPQGRAARVCRWVTGIHPVPHARPARAAARIRRLEPDRRPRQIFGPHPELEIVRHLVVAETARVEAPCGFADHLYSGGLPFHVDVFQHAVRELRRAPRSSDTTVSKPFPDRFGVAITTGCLAAPHARMGAGPTDVLFRQSLVRPIEGG